MATRKQLAALRKARAAKAKKHRRHNPARVRYVTKRTTHRRRRRNPWYDDVAGHSKAAKKGWRARRSTRSRRRRRHNPIGFDIKGFMSNTLIPSAIGAGGALSLDLAMAYLPLPVMMKTGIVNTLTRVVGAVGLGMLGGMVMGHKRGEQIGAGALTVVLYDELKGMLKKAMPTLPLAGSDYPNLEYVNPGYPGGADMGLYVGEYVTGDETIIGNADYGNYSY